AAGPAPAGAAVISYREQQALCLLLIAAPPRPIDPFAATHVVEPEASTRRAAAAYGASVTPLLAGSQILAFELEGSVADVVAAAARCALVIGGERPEARLALALGRGEQRGGSVVGGVIDQVSRLAAAGEAGSIVVEAAAARALAAAFELEA